MALIGKIRGMRMRDGKSISEISRLTSLSRNTIKKWLKTPQGAAPKYHRRDVATKLAPLMATLMQALEGDARRPKRERRTARALHVQLTAEGYDGGYTRLTDFIREWRDKQGKLISTNAFVPLAFELGEAFQFDWSEEGLVVGGIYYRLQVSHLKLCASRAFWLVAYPSQGHEMLFDAHTRSFAALGGIPRRGIYDNMKTAVDKVKKGKGRVVNARFAVMCAHYLFDPDFCNVASGWEKVVVEKNVQDSRRRIWIDAAKLRFGSFVELNAWIANRCRWLWTEVRHPEHKQFSVAEMLEHERDLWCGGQCRVHQLGHRCSDGRDHGLAVAAARADVSGGVLRRVARQDPRGRVVRNKAIYLALGVLPDGTRDILGLWIEGTEGAKFWMKVFNDLKTRGVNDILIAVTNGLKGMGEALGAVFPATTLQTCIVHLIRNSLDYASWKDRKMLAAAIKPIYRAPSAEAAEADLASFERGPWGRKFPTVVAAWRRAWDRVIPFFAFPPAVRKVIYTTNAIESINARLRKIIKTRGHFPSDDAATKLIWLALRNITADWGRAAPNWKTAMNQFAILYADRFKASAT